MQFEEILRTQLNRLLTGEGHIALESKVPSLESRFQAIDELGLYLHIPFCCQICPYCPYNKEIYDPEVAQRYADAVKKEIDIYARLVGERPVTSFYIGGGTPTTMLNSGLEGILVLQRHFAAKWGSTQAKAALWRPQWETIAENCVAVGSLIPRTGHLRL